MTTSLARARHGEHHLQIRVQEQHRGGRDWALTSMTSDLGRGLDADVETDEQLADEVDELDLRAITPQPSS